MKRLKGICFCITGVLAVLCLLMSSTDLFLKEEVVKIKKISVYMAAEESAYAGDFKRGIYEIANEERVDISYVLLSDSSPEELSEQAEREFMSGVQALIVFAEDPSALCRVNAFLDGTLSVSDVSFDARAAAEELFAELQEKDREKQEVVLLVREGISEKIGQAVKGVLLEKGIEAVCEKAGESTARKYENEKETPVVIGCWPTETEWAVEHLKNGTIYGIGYSDQILKEIQEGMVEGIAAFSMYGIGIQAMRQAIAMIEKERAEDIELSCRMVTKENMEEQKEFLIPIH